MDQAWSEPSSHNRAASAAHAQDLRPSVALSDAARLCGVDSLHPSLKPIETYKYSIGQEVSGSHWQIPHVHPMVQPPAQGWEGIGASVGTAEGPCRIVKTLQAASEIQMGDILVCSYTDPAWTPHLARVAGVISETGGVLSHAR